MVRIPNHIVKNEKFKLDNKPFVLYAYFKYLEFTSYKQAEPFEVSHKEVMKVMGIKDIKVFKKCLKALYENGLMTNLIENLPRNNTLMTVQLTHNEETETEKYYTQLPYNLLKKIPEIGDMAIRLLYYYESYIDRKNVHKGKDKAYPSQQTIKDDLKCSYSTIDKYNDILVKYKLLKVKTFDPVMDGYDILDRALFHRWNNHYFVKKENIEAI